MKTFALVLASTVLHASIGGAQASVLPPIRQLGPVSATAHETFLQITAIRDLPGGRVLVNDPGGRRVLMFDSTLTTVTIVADSTSATANAYSGQRGGLIAYRGDSTLFVDPTSMSMLVIDPAGKVGRVMSVPRTQDAMFLTGGPLGTPGFDASGRLVYRAQNFRFPMQRPTAGSLPVIPPQPDTAPVIRVDLATRQVDTVAFIKIPKVSFNVSQDDRGGIRVSTTVNPLSVVDEWAVLPDGGVALVRGRDYHVDWINADGSRTTSPKVPFEWQRLTDEDKVAFIDSVKAARERMAANSPGGGKDFTFSGTSATAAAGAAAPPAAKDGGRVVIIGAEGAPPPRGGAPGGAGVLMAPQISYVSPSDLPDYKPPFFSGGVRADAEGNLWVRTIPTKAIPGGPIYDVINRKGELVQRVQIPMNRIIIGFGAGGIVYMTAREGTGPMTLERARSK